MFDKIIVVSDKIDSKALNDVQKILIHNLQQKYYLKKIYPLSSIKATRDTLPSIDIVGKGTDYMDVDTDVYIDIDMDVDMDVKDIKNNNIKITNLFKK
jgi:hypothetical protein